MAEIDLGIYRNFLSAPKSIQDYDNEAMQANQNALAYKSQQAQYNALQRQQAEDQQHRDAAKSFGADTQANYNALMSKGLVRQAQDYQKAILEGRDKMSSINEREAKTKTANYDLARKQAEHGITSLVAAGTPDAAKSLIQQGVTKGLWGMDEAQGMIAEVPADQDAYQQWRQQKLLGIVSAKDQLDNAMKQQEFGLRANNELIGPDGKINQTLLGAKKQVAQAGASSVNVNTGQKGFDNELKLRGDFKQEPVYKAHQEMQSAYSQIKQSLTQATPAGDLAGATKIMKLLDPGSVVRESELGMAMAATGLLDRVQNYAQNIVSGNKLTPKQRVEFQQLADALYGESIKAYNNKRSEYTKLGGEYGLNAERAIGGPASLAAKPGGGGDIHAQADEILKKGK